MRGLGCLLQPFALNSVLLNFGNALHSIHALNKLVSNKTQLLADETHVIQLGLAMRRRKMRQAAAELGFRPLATLPKDVALHLKLQNRLGQSAVWMVSPML